MTGIAISGPLTGIASRGCRDPVASGRSVGAVRDIKGASRRIGPQTAHQDEEEGQRMNRPGTFELEIKVGDEFIPHVLAIVLSREIRSSATGRVQITSDCNSSEELEG